MTDKHASDLQSDIAIADNKVTGKLKYIESWTAFDTKDNTGNFLMLKIDEAMQSKVVTTKIEGEGASGKVVTLDNDGIIIYHVHAKTNKITITCEGVDRVLDLSGLDLATSIEEVRTKRRVTKKK